MSGRELIDCQEGAHLEGMGTQCAVIYSRGGKIELAMKSGAKVRISTRDPEFEKFAEPWSLVEVKNV